MVAVSSGRSDAQVDDLRRDSVGRQRLRRVQRLPQRAAIGDQRHIPSGTPDHGFADIDRPAIRAEGAGDVVEHDMLEDDHRIGILQGRPQHVAGVLDRRRGHDLEAGHMGVPVFQAMGMLGGELPAGAGGDPDDHRHVELTARHVPDGGGVVDDLIERQQAEIDRHDLDDRPHAAERRTDAGADEGRIRTAACRGSGRGRTRPAGPGSRRSSRHNARHPRPSGRRAHP